MILLAHLYFGLHDVDHGEALIACWCY